jgi:aspartyl/glutamyl-tRNA(Asn/Gln) amidotransferase C subunit
MTDKVDVRALAKLSRLDITDEEVAKLEKEIPTILSFVEIIQKASTDVPGGDPELRNVMREDTNPYESGEFTKDILAAAPETKDDQVVVKQVISRK